MKYLAPIVLFVYNRPVHAQRTIEFLAKNDLASESRLFVFADGAKPNATEDQKAKVRETRDVVSSIQGFKSVELCFAEKNKGLANSVIEGVTKIVNEYGRVIVVEDDLETSPFFLRYMNEALDFYQDDKRIFTIGGYNYPLQIPTSYNYDIYASYRCESWGWATWKERWEKADWDVTHYKVLNNPTKRNIRKFNRGGDDLYGMLLDRVNGRNDSWAIRWQNCLYENDGLCISPVKTFVRNIGFDGSGVHCGDNESVVSAPMYEGEYTLEWVPAIKPDKDMTDAFSAYFHIVKESLLVKYKRLIKKTIKKLLYKC